MDLGHEHDGRRGPSSRAAARTWAWCPPALARRAAPLHAPLVPAPGARVGTSSRTCPTASPSPSSPGTSCGRGGTGSWPRPSGPPPGACPLLVLGLAGARGGRARRRVVPRPLALPVTLLGSTLFLAGPSVLGQVWPGIAYLALHDPAARGCTLKQITYRSRLFDAAASTLAPRLARRARVPRRRDAAPAQYHPRGRGRLQQHPGHRRAPVAGRGLRVGDPAAAPGPHRARSLATLPLRDRRQHHPDHEHGGGWPTTWGPGRSRRAITCSTGR